MKKLLFVLGCRVDSARLGLLPAGRDCRTLTRGCAPKTTGHESATDSARWRTRRALWRGWPDALTPRLEPLRGRGSRRSIIPC